MEYLVSYNKWIGIIAGIFTAAALVPTLIKLIKEKKPENVSIGMLVVLMVGLSLWIYYGVINKDWPIMITNTVSLLQNVTLIVLRHKFKNNQQSHAK